MSFSLLYLSIGVYGWVPDLRSLLVKLQHSLLCTMDMYREEEEQKIEREKLGFKEERLLKREGISDNSKPFLNEKRGHRFDITVSQNLPHKLMMSLEQILPFRCNFQRLVSALRVSF